MKLDILTNIFKLNLYSIHLYIYIFWQNCVQQITLNNYSYTPIYLFPDTLNNKFNADYYLFWPITSPTLIEPLLKQKIFIRIRWLH